MGFKKTLVSLLAPVIMATSSPSCQPAYARDGISGPRSVAPQQVRKIELNEQNNYSALELFKLDSYQDQAARQVKGDSQSMISVEANFDKESGNLQIVYGLEGKTIPAMRGRAYGIDSPEFQKSGMPPSFLNDSISFIYLVSDSSEGLEVSDIKQWGRFHGQSVERRRLIPREQKVTDRAIMYVLDKGFDKAVEAGAMSITGGGYAAAQAWDGAVDLFGFPDSMKVDASARLKNYLEGVSQKSSQAREQGVEDSLQGVSLGLLSLFRDPRLTNLSNSFIAREIQMNVQNNTFEDQNLSVYFLNTRFQDIHNWHSDLKDVEVQISLPAKSKLEDYLGDWKIKKIFSDGGILPEEFWTGKLDPILSLRKDVMIFQDKDSTRQDKMSINSIFPFSKDYVLFSLTEDTVNLSTGKSVLGAGALRLEGKDKLWMSRMPSMRSSKLKDFFNSLDSRKIEDSFKEQGFVFERFTEKRNSSSPDSLMGFLEGSWSVKSQPEYVSFDVGASYSFGEDNFILNCPSSGSFSERIGGYSTISENIFELFQFGDNGLKFSQIKKIDENNILIIPNSRKSLDPTKIKNHLESHGIRLGRD